MHFLHLTFRVRDITESVRFYKEFVGLTMQKRFSMGAWEIAFLADKTGATQIELVCAPEGVKAEAQGITVCFQADDLDSVHQRAQEWGLNPSEIRVPDETMRYFYVYDPDGLSIEFKELR